MLRLTTNKSLISIWLIGLSTAALCFFTVEFYESRKLNDQLVIQFNNKIKLLDQSMRSLSELIYSTRDFMQNGNNPDRNQFKNYLRDRTGIDSGINTVFWLPNIKLTDVNKFETQANKSGLLSYQLFPNVQQAKPCEIWSRSSTLPVYYGSPEFEASDYLGQRMEANCTDAKAMENALTYKKITTSLYTENGHQGMRFFLPVMEGNEELKGFIVANILLHEFLGVTWKNEINADNINLSVVNLTPLKPTAIFQSHVNTRLEQLSSFDRETNYTKQVTFPIINQKWQISITTLDNANSVLFYGSAAVMLILMLTASVSSSVRFYTNRLKISDQLVQEKTRSLAIQATQDELTGLFNRKALNEQLERLLGKVKSQQSHGFSILFIDLDRFKIINDSMGHLAGDQVLQQVANRLLANIRTEDECYRFGGDEFVICLPNQTDRQVLNDLSQRFSQIISEPYLINDQPCHLASSIGVSIVTSPNRSQASILREADTAMYKAKHLGADKVMFFNEKMYIQVKQRFKLEQALAHAVSDEQLELAFQPIYCQKTEQVSGFEALLRWNMPEKGPICPGKFIPIAEETGLILDIGDWVVQQTCQILEGLWRSNSLNHIPRININVSAKQFESNHIINTVRDALNHFHFPPHLLGIEITESFLIGHSTCTVNALTQLKQLGVTIYLDDFGTGYSSLSVLSEYPVDIVKMDRSFVRDIDKGNHKAVQLCQAIISMSHAISLNVVAEGVETTNQLTTLNEFGCDYIQGFLLAKPVTKSEITHYLSYKINHLQQVG